MVWTLLVPVPHSLEEIVAWSELMGLLSCTAKEIVQLLQEMLKALRDSLKDLYGGNGRELL